MEELKVGTKAYAMDECHVPYWLIPVTCSFLYYTTEDHQPRSGTTHNGLAPPTSITNKENALTNLPIGQFYGSIFSVVIPFSQICLAFCPPPLWSVDKKKSIRMSHI